MELQCFLFELFVEIFFKLLEEIVCGAALISGAAKSVKSIRVNLRGRFAYIADPPFDAVQTVRGFDETVALGRAISASVPDGRVLQHASLHHDSR